MAFSKVRANLKSDVVQVWEKIIDFENYGWRSDLSKTEKLNEREFIEYDKDGRSTKFLITAIDKYKYLEFKIENEAIKGEWIGIFKSDGDTTLIDFTEDIEAKKLFLKPILGFYLKSKQKTFIADLRKALGE